MENLINLDIIEKNKSLIEGTIFTKLQLNILKKKLNKKSLNINEKTYYYKFIKPKIRAMMAFFNIDDININGKRFILEERISEAVDIIKKLEKRHKKKKIMLSGSFLFNEHYNDIDIFIFTKYNKEDYIDRKVHVNFLPESAIESLFFSSVSQISVSNFSYATSNNFILSLNDVLQTYELLVNSILKKENYEQQLRDFILQTEYFSKGIIPNPEQLYKQKETLSTKSVAILSSILINALIVTDNKGVIRGITKQLNAYKELSKSYRQSKNLNTYIDTYSTVIELAS